MATLETELEPQRGRAQGAVRGFLGDGAATDDTWFATVLPRARFLVPALVLLAILKLLNVYAVVPLADEGYYWLWGKFPEWSYFDHPPLGGWMQMAVTAVIGDGLWAVRTATLPVFAGTLWILWFWAGQLAPEPYRMRTFLTAIGVLLGSPWMMQYQSIVFHDYLLIGTGMAAAHFFALFVRSDRTGQPYYAHLYAACFFLGLAGLSKYSGVFLGLGFGAWVLATAQGRRLLLTPHLWAAASLAVAMQAPVVYWNMINGWPSFQYNLHDRIGDVMHDSAAYRIFDWVKNFFMVLSPILAISLLRFLVVPSRSPALAAFQGPGRWAFVVSTGAFLALSLSTSVLYYWNVPAILFFLPVALFFFRTNFEVRLHMMWGICFAAMATFNATVFPMTAKTGTAVSDFNISHGLHQVAAAIAEEEERLGADMVLTTDYRTASLVALTMERTDIMAIGERKDMFDFWFKPEDAKGKDAILLTYNRFPETETATKVFESVTPIRDIEIMRHGTVIQRYRLFYAKNHSGSGPH